MVNSFNTLHTLSSTKNWSLAIVVALTLLGFGLRVICLDCQSLRGDEAISATYSSLPLGEILEISRLSEPHPPLFYLVMNRWESLAGFTAFAVRLWAVFPAVLLVPSVYVLARRLVNWEVAFVAAGLVAINSFHIWHAQDARSYTWLALLGAWATLFFWQSLHQNRWVDWLAYGISLAVSIYVHYYAIFLMAFHGIYLLRYVFEHRAEGFRPIITWVSVMIGVGAAFVPWFWVSWQFIAQYTADLDRVLPGAVLWRGWQAFSGGVVTSTPVVALWTIPFMLLTLVGVWWLWRIHQPKASYLCLYLALPFLGVMALTLRGQTFTERYLIAALPAYLIFLAAGLVWLGRQGGVISRSLVIVCLTGIVWFNLQTIWKYQADPTLAKSPAWQKLFDHINDAHNPQSDILIYDFPEAAVTYYLDTLKMDQPSDAPTMTTVLVPYAPNPTFQQVDEALQTLLADYERVWFVPINGSGWDDSGFVETWLTRHADQIDSASFHWTNGNLYLTPSQIDRVMTRQSTTFVGGITLQGFHMTNIEAGSGGIATLVDDRLELSLYWQSTGPSDKPLTVFTQLIGPQGVRRGGQDNQPVWGTYPTTDWQDGERIIDKFTLQLEPESPPGQYQVWVGLYDTETGERVFSLDGAGQPTADHIVLDLNLTVE